MIQFQRFEHDRFKIASQPTPAPGQYYNAKLASSLKVKSKNIESQCFDSTSLRFLSKPPESVPINDFIQNE